MGEGARMKEIFQFLAQVAPTESTVLIEGKVERARNWRRVRCIATAPGETSPLWRLIAPRFPSLCWRAICLGMSGERLRAQRCQKKGRLEVADGGVVFLDEIGELAPALQVKLLRVLQEREFERVGSTHTIKVDIRLIAATNRDLNEAVRKGEFRQDLYYRLAVVKLTMPTLRERKEDIPMLTRHFVQKYAKRSKVKPKPVSREAMAALVNYEWPGNVRELENAIERALVMGSSDMVLLEDLPESLLEQVSRRRCNEGKYQASVKGLKKQ